ncbi:YadA C-terminal domain-containing protein [Acinetobacter sp. YH12025]|uniref:YadA-like family protein n=1 Tax=Acinetobacter sp. YH12025 TaxID=2601042 RepID=UPI0015D1582B|nr:YadA C-terminal domain-containing protein [Acinetobacter sp. YH12025]
MKFQKTLLAASLAFLAVGANAKNANPTQQSEGLFNSTGYVFSPVLNQGTNWADLGTGAVTSVTGSGSQVTYEIFNYKTVSGKDVVSVTKLGSKTSEGFFEFVKDAAGNDQLVEYKGNDVLLDTLSNGGQLTDSTAGTTTTGYELKEINNEHLVYGYQGNVGGLNQQLQGAYINPEGVSTQFTGTLFVPGTSNSKYVNSGIIGNTGAYDAVTGQPLDVSKNIYGVSAKDGNNFVALTGNGIALADLSLGTLQYDGSVITNEKQVGAANSSTLKTRQYTIGGRTILEVYNDDAGNEVAPKFYAATQNADGNYTLAGVADVTAADVADLLPIRTGTATYTTGKFEQAVVHNTITNKNVTYSESVTSVDKSKLQAGIVQTTTATGATAVANENVGEATIKTTQSVSTGVINKVDDQNVYGVEVKKTTVDSEGKQTTATTKITADYVDSGDFRINGVSIVDNIKSSVDGAVAGATEAIDAKVAEVDQKIVQVDERLTQFNTVAAGLNSRVDQLNSRIDDVEKTAYRGVAIALAAQQQIPNIGAGQFAVFGGVGHYEGESAGALGVASVFADGRTSLSAAIGVAGGSEVGGRVGLSYVFGGK